MVDVSGEMMIERSFGSTNWVLWFRTRVLRAATGPNTTVLGSRHYAVVVKVAPSYWVRSSRSPGRRADSRFLGASTASSSR